jgi:threonylcarbamoyladenosine tRNA methylthiotransferase MtaB
MKKVAFFTLGCRANQYQTEILKNEHSSSEFRITSFDYPADIYVINTCSVTADADRKSRQAIRKALRQNPDARIIVTGCYAKLEQKELQKISPKIEIKVPAQLPSTDWQQAPRVRSHLMIEDGCDNDCAYCIVPKARGPIKSKPVDEVLKEASSLVKAGAREIVLTGINLGAYQHDLASLIPRLSSLADLIRIRLSSIESMYLTKELINAVADDPKTCNFFHVPLQTGSDKLLKNMGRTYDRQEYIKMIDYIRKKIPDCGISTDLIVGLPGEGENEFQETVDLVKQLKFSRLHVFPYSKRKGTKAAEMLEQVDDKIKKARSRILHDHGKQLMQEFAAQYLGQTVEILLERKGEGLTSNFIRCYFDGSKEELGEQKNVLVKKIKNGSCLTVLSK